MSKAQLGKPSLAEMTIGRTGEAAALSRDGSLVNIEDGSVVKLEPRPALEITHQLQDSFLSRSDPLAKESFDKKTKRAFGLPQGYSVSSRYGRTVLFEDNIYRLPNGSEFIPQQPSGTLGSRNHQYALLTAEQYKKKTRGSVYVRSDGRVFDYAVDNRIPEREMFDTGFTIHDLERTGRYAPERSLRRPEMRKNRKRKRAVTKNQ